MINIRLKHNIELLIHQYDERMITRANLVTRLLELAKEYKDGELRE